jgi:hypothetical protein
MTFIAIRPVVRTTHPTGSPIALKAQSLQALPRSSN